jgi:hypothetical protein
MLRRLRPLQRAATLSLCAALAAALTGCEPCAGVANCSNDAYLAATGQIVDAATRQGVDGVRIDAIRVGGIGVGRDSISTVTSGGGFWRLEFTPTATGTLDVDFVVSPPSVDPYRLHGIRLATREHGGDANLNERWVTVLYFNHLLEIYRRGTADSRIEGARVQFTRTGGVELRGPGAVNGVFRDTTDFGGRMPLFPSQGGNAVYPVNDGAVVGDLSITTPDLGTTVLRGFFLTSSHLYKDPAAIERYDIGASPSP